MPTSPITEKAVGPPPPSRVPPPPPPNAAIPRLIASPAAKLDGPATAAVLSPERFTDAARAEAAETLAAHRPGPKVLTKDGKRKRAVLTKKANRRPGVPVEGTEKKPTVPTEGADKKPAGAKTQKKAGVKDFWVRDITAPRIIVEADRFCREYFLIRQGWTGLSYLLLL